MPTPSSSHPLESAEDTLAIFGRPSGWMLYWGSAAIVGCFVILLLFISWVNYPDKVITEVTITADAPPVPVVTRAEGVVARIFVEEGDSVVAQQLLLVLDNSATLEDVIYLEDILTGLNKVTSPLDVPSLQLPSYLELGTLGRSYTQLQNLGTEITYWLDRQNNRPRIRQLTQQLQEVKKSQDILREQLETQKLETQLAKDQMNQFQELFVKEAASKLEVDQAVTNYLRAEKQIKEQENRLTINSRQEAELQEARFALGETVSDEIMERWLHWQAERRKLQQELYEWQEQYLLRAENSGSISFYENIYPGLFVAPHQVVMGIVPSPTSKVYLAEGMLPQTASGKILPGARAYLELEAYPSREFGQVPAEVQQIALATKAEGGGYRLVLSLPAGLHTSYGIDLLPRQQLKARAFLLSEDKSLLNRLLDHLWEVGRNE